MGRARDIRIVHALRTTLHAISVDVPVLVQQKGVTYIYVRII